MDASLLSQSRARKQKVPNYLSVSDWFELEQVVVFKIDHERWLVGYLPTVNYQATVTIYKLVE